MFEKSRIEKGLYWDKSWTLVSGCTPCSPGCEHCWALAREKRFQRTYSGIYSGKIRIHPERLDIPLKRKKPTVWAIWNDLFHEDVPFEFIDAAFRKMIIRPDHIYLLLTKRVKKMAEYFEGTKAFHHNEPFKYIWPGVTVCNPDELWKMDDLRKIPAAIHWISFEPLLAGLGKINFDHIELCVLGGESGSRARPMYPEWVRLVRDQCIASGTKFFFKQWGRIPYPPNSDIYPWIEAGFDPYSKSKNGGRFLDGREYNELPEVK